MSSSPLLRMNRWHVEAAGAGLLAVISLVAFLGIVNPSSDAATTRLATQVELEDKRTLVAQIQDLRRQLKQQIARVQQERERTWVHLNSARHLNERTAQIIGLASSKNLVIDETSSGEAQSQERYQTILIHVAGTGTYSQSAAFLHDLHDELHDVSVVGFELSDNPSTPSTRATFQFDLQWYAAPLTAVNAE